LEKNEVEIKNTALTKTFTACTIAALLGVGCAGGPLSTREKSAGIGALGGAAAGGIIGSAVGHAAIGEAIGGPVGLIAGALIGDQLLAQEKRQDDQQRQIDQNRAELERQRRENERQREQPLER
jgi:outer membrane lipoprotein SlyB